MDGRITIEGRVMRQFCQGAREAEYLIDREPGRVGHQLKRALSDRRRWRTRLFQRERARFLDGYIVGLEPYEAGPQRCGAIGPPTRVEVRLRESNVAQAISALNQSGWSAHPATTTLMTRARRPTRRRPALEQGGADGGRRRQPGPGACAHCLTHPGSSWYAPSALRPGLPPRRTKPGCSRRGLSPAILSHRVPAERAAS